MNPTKYIPNKTFITLAAAALGILLCSCAATSVKKTWKSPDYKAGPPKCVAVIAVHDQGLVRQAFENRFVSQLKQRGQPAIVTFEMFSLQRIKADKEAVAKRAQEAGADTVLIVRLVSQQSKDREVRPTGEIWAPTITGFGYDMWYDYYTVAFMDMGTVWHDNRMDVYLESSLFDLKTGKRIWTGVTETVLKDNMDRVEEINPLAAKVLDALQKDGLIR